MSVSKQCIIKLRKDRGWSQEKLAAISGLSERTIQRIEKDGNCSLDSQMALAVAFDVSPTELTVSEEELKESDFQTDWSGAFGLLIMGLLIPTVILLTGTNGQWEMASFFLVIGITVILSILSHGLKKTHRLFDRTSWIVKYPKRVSGLGSIISHAKVVINNTYIIACVASFITALTLAIHKPEMLGSVKMFIIISLKPLVYGILFVEFWFRPYKRKMEKMLADQNQYK